jgi:hypothetical protein
MNTKETLLRVDSAPSRIVPIDATSRVALGLLRQAYCCAQDAGADLWDFALETGRLFDTGMTISDLRWLVAKGFAEHGQEQSVYGGPHRAFRRGQGFFFDQVTCVVLTPSGAAFVDQVLAGPVVSLHLFQHLEIDPIAGTEAAVLDNLHPANDDPSGTTGTALKPCWNSRRRELSLDGRVIKRYRVPAPNQEAILSAFEEEGWPEHIDDPLPVRGDIDPPTRLHDVINRLNGCQSHRLLRFTGNGNGDGVCWELRQAVRVAPNRRPGNGNRVAL